MKKGSESTFHPPSPFYHPPSPSTGHMTDPLPSTDDFLASWPELFSTETNLGRDSRTRTLNASKEALCLGFLALSVATRP